MSVLSPQGHANPNLLAALAHGVGEHAVDSYRSQHTSDAREETKHHGIEALRGDGTRSQVAHGHEHVDGNVGIDVADRRAHGRHRQRGITDRANRE